jgi:hypothetical protein
MNADELTRAFTALEPSARLRRRMEARVAEPSVSTPKAMRYCFTS